MTVCDADVALLLQRYAYGATPPDGVAVHVMPVAVAAPAQVTASASACAMAAGTASTATSADAAMVRNDIVMYESY